MTDTEPAGPHTDVSTSMAAAWADALRAARAATGGVRVVTYHPDLAIDAEVRVDALVAERADLAADYPPRWWLCPDCGATHRRGWFMAEDVHRCLGCGYVGMGGTMHTNRPRPAGSEEGT